MKVGVGLKPATTVLDLKGLLGTSLRTIFSIFSAGVVVKSHRNMDKVNFFFR